MNWDSPRATQLGLAPFSLLYALGWTTYAGIYRLGLKRPYMPTIPVVCVGNLTVGGTGKTPMVMHLVEVLRSLGREVIISCSGYGSPAARDATLAPPGPLDPAEWGDEAVVLREEIAECPPLIVGRNRVMAAQLAEGFPVKGERSESLALEGHPDPLPRLREEGWGGGPAEGSHSEEATRPNRPGGNELVSPRRQARAYSRVLLLDDGFQHLPLAKDISIILDPPRHVHLCLPAGPYREPRGAGLRRADLVIPGKFEAVFDVNLSEGVSGEVDVLCALGRPARFIAMLEGLGLRVANARLLRDHDPLTAGNLLDGLGQVRPLVVTSKDWVKLRQRTDLENRRVVVARLSARVEPEAEFRKWLGERLDEADAARN